MENIVDLTDHELSILINKVLSERLNRNRIPKKIIDCFYELGIDFKKNGDNKLNACITCGKEIISKNEMPTNIVLGMECSKEIYQLNSNFNGIDLYRCILNKGV